MRPPRRGLSRLRGGAARSSWLARSVVPASLLLAGCASDPCEEAAQLCADQRQSEAQAEDGPDSLECEGEIERLSTCILDAGSCAPADVEACWRQSAESSR